MDLIWRIFVATWIVAGKSPTGSLNLEDWLHNQHLADIYVFGFNRTLKWSYRTCNWSRWLPSKVGCFFHFIPVIHQCDANIYVANNQGEVYSVSIRTLRCKCFYGALTCYHLHVLCYAFYLNVAGLRVFGWQRKPTIPSSSSPAVLIMYYLIESDEDVLWKANVRETKEKLAIRGKKFLNWFWSWSYGCHWRQHSSNAQPHRIHARKPQKILVIWET